MNAPRRATHQRPPYRIRINRPNLYTMLLVLVLEAAMLAWAWALIPG